MANIKSAIKRARQNRKRNSLKSGQRSSIRTAIKTTESLIQKEDKKLAIRRAQSSQNHMFCQGILLS